MTTTAVRLMCYKKQKPIFGVHEWMTMKWAAQAIGHAADKVPCEVCKSYADTVSPCSPCFVTQGTYRS